MVFVWFLFLGVPIGIKMNKWGRKNTVLLGMTVTIVGMMIPLVGASWACLVGYAALGIGNAILQVSENPLIKNVVTDEQILTSSLTAGQVVKAISSFCGPFIMLFAVNVLGDGDYQKWYLAFPVLGTITLLSALWLILSPIKREPKESTDVTVAKTFSLLRNPTILIMIACIAIILSLAFIQLPATWALAQIGAIGFFCSCIFPIIYSEAVKADPKKANLISGLMITAVAGGGAATPLIGFATDACGSITSGVLVLLLCAVDLLCCAFAVEKVRR